MKITVVGGSGFIGTHLVRRLQASGLAVHVFDLRPPSDPGVSWTRGDVRDAGAIGAALEGAAMAIDLAAEHRDDVRPVSRYAEVNVGGARQLAAAAARQHVPAILFASSAAVYGRHQPGATEASAVQPDTPYGRSKADAEAVYAAWQREDAARRALIVVRPSIVYGEGHRGNMRVLIEQLRRGRFALVDGGRNRKSIGYVGNLVAFLEQRLATAPGHRVFNFADPPAPTVRELVDEVLALLPDAPKRVPSLPLAAALPLAWLAQGVSAVRGRPAAILPRRVRALRADTTLGVDAMLATGFVAPYARRDGLRRTVESDGHG